MRPEPFDLVLTHLSMPHIDGRQVSETLRRYRPPSPFSACPPTLTRFPTSNRRIPPSGCCSNRSRPTTCTTRYVTPSTDLAAVAEAEIVRAHAGLSQLAFALDASRTMRVQPWIWPSLPVSCGRWLPGQAEWWTFALYNMHRLGGVTRQWRN